MGFERKEGGCRELSVPLGSGLFLLLWKEGVKTQGSQMWCPGHGDLPGRHGVLIALPLLCCCLF